MINNTSGVILAGGRSSRIGSQKAFLTVRGKRLIDIILEVLHSLFEEIFIVTDDKNHFVEFKGVEIIEDLIKGCGPLAGIYTGLKAISHDKAFFIACDMPFLHIGLINKLLEAATHGDFDCVLPYTDKGIEPLHAIYSKKILTSLESSLMRREFSIIETLTQLNCKYIKVETNQLSSFFNINTPYDLKEAESYEGKI